MSDDTSADYLLGEARRSILDSVGITELDASGQERDSSQDAAEHEAALRYATACAAIAAATTAREILAELKEANGHLRALRGLP